jgi:hypothetical protein
MPEWQGKKAEQTGTVSRRPKNRHKMGGERLGKFCSRDQRSQEVRASQDAVMLPAGIGGLLKSQPATPPKTMLNPKVSRKCA